MIKFDNGWQINAYSAYHDLDVLALFYKNDKLYTESIRDGKVVICFYLFTEDTIPEGTHVKKMKFSEFYALIVKNGYKYFDYYYSPKPIEWFWSTDAYPAFTKDQLDSYLSKNKDARYDFLGRK